MTGFEQRILSFLLVIFCVAQLAVRAEAQGSELLGEWRQVESNAGKCPGCTISIRRVSSDLSVIANNGWFANIVETNANDSISASGNGQWTLRRNTFLGGKAFSADFVLKGSRLHLTMRIDMRNGSRRVVRAVFTRVWLGA